MLRLHVWCALLCSTAAFAADAVVDYGPATREHAELRRALIDRQPLELVADLFPRVFRLPRPMILRARECDSPIAWYRPSNGAIEVCYSYVAQLERQLGDKGARRMLAFTLYHEVGHLLIDELKLPVLGREEDAADRFAAVFVLSADASMGASVTAAAARYFREAHLHKEPTFWDAHSTAGQRFYDLLCLLKGRSAEQFSALVDDGVLPADRARGCSDEYREVRGSWNALLRPYSRIEGGVSFPAE